MSRIGKRPIELDSKVEVKIDGSKVSVKGPKGNLSYTFTDQVKIKQEGKTIVVEPSNTTNTAKAMWGTTRTVISNMVVGVVTGFTKSLEYRGVGYKATAKGNILELNLGYSHPIAHKLPEGISAKVEKNVIHITGSNKEIVGQVAAKIRSYRPPEPYKGKGIKYTTERIIRKAGKTGGK
ncbi:50S ribosomal protein L6 [Bacteriovoracales bacterium]|nr:50S ribosomal protein L6 [Bacteriovoracales bacterium]